MVEEGRAPSGLKTDQPILKTSAKTIERKYVAYEDTLNLIMNEKQSLKKYSQMSLGDDDFSVPGVLLNPITHISMEEIDQVHAATKERMEKALPMLDEPVKEWVNKNV